MKRMIIISVLYVFLITGIVFAESNFFYYDYVKEDWFAVQSAADAILPENLSAREIDIYRAAYANGFYDALHPAYIEGIYMLNTKTKKYHLTNCPSTLLIESNNRQYSTLTPEELKAQNYKPCGQCHPEVPTTK